MNLDAITDPVVREEFKKMRRELLLLRTKVSQASRSVIGATGGVRAGSAADRGIAAQRYPELYIEVDLGAATPKATLYWTTPTDLAGGSYQWAKVGSITLS